MNDQWVKVGTVEIMIPRVMPIDPESRNPYAVRTEVTVMPGSYPVYRKGSVTCWIMTGAINERNEKIGDGLFVLGSSDTSTGLEVQFPSPVFGPEQFEEFLGEPICQAGPQQRLRFELDMAMSE